MKQIIKSFKIYTDDTDEEKVLVGNDINTALEILENNGYIVEVEYEKMKINIETDAQYDQRKGSEVLDALEKAYNEDQTSCIWLLDTVKETIDFLKKKGY